MISQKLLEIENNPLYSNLHEYRLQPEKKISMHILSLHQEGRFEYLEQLKQEFNKKLEKIRETDHLSDEEKDQAILNLKLEYKKLKNQSEYGLF